MKPVLLQINFSQDNLIVLNICLALIMFGVALNIRKSHFTQLINDKKSIATGLISQIFLLPALTFLLVLVLPVSTGTAMGMILVAACPGGNVSNYFSMVAKGNLALSVTLTAISSLLAFTITPLNFFFWTSLIPSLSGEMKLLEISFMQLFLNMVLVLLLPLIAGMWLADKKTSFAEKIGKPIRTISMVILMLFIVMAFYNNYESFRKNFLNIFWIVLVHNGLAFVGAYYFSKLLKNTEPVNRTVAIETGIQNSGLALVIIFTFFNANFDMAIIAAWWGIWHMIAGYGFALLMKNKKSNEII